MTDMRHKFRAWIRNEYHHLLPHTPKEGESHWKEAWVMAEVLTIHLAKQRVRCRYRKDGALVMEEGTVVDVRDYDIGDDCILMQWTGLYDDHKKEVYEGDILLMEEQFTSNRWEVIWEGIGFSLIDADREGDEFGVYRRRLDAPGKRTMKVVGNIYQK